MSQVRRVVALFLPPTDRRKLTVWVLVQVVVIGFFFLIRSATGIDTVPTDLPNVAESTAPAGSATGWDVPPVPTVGAIPVPTVGQMPTSTVPVATVPVSVPMPTVPPTVSATQQTVAPVDSLGNDVATGMAPCEQEDSSTAGAWFPCVWRNYSGPVERIEYTYSGAVVFYTGGAVELRPIFFGADGQVIAADWLAQGDYADCYGPCPVADGDATHLYGPECAAEDEIGCVFLDGANDSAVPNESTPFQSCVSVDRETLIPATAVGAGEPEAISDPSLIVADPIVCPVGAAD